MFAVEWKLSSTSSLKYWFVNTFAIYRFCHYQVTTHARKNLSLSDKNLVLAAHVSTTQFSNLHFHCLKSYTFLFLPFVFDREWWKKFLFLILKKFKQRYKLAPILLISVTTFFFLEIIWVKIREKVDFYWHLKRNLNSDEGIKFKPFSFEISLILQWSLLKVK